MLYTATLMVDLLLEGKRQPLHGRWLPLALLAYLSVATFGATLTRGSVQASIAGVAEIGGTLRPIANAGSPLGVGVLADLYGTYWGKGYFVNLMVQPLGLGWTEEGNVVSTAALVEGGYDSRAFSVGLGVGISAINGDTDAMLSKFSGSDAAPLGEGEVRVTDKQETGVPSGTLSESLLRDGRPSDVPRHALQLLSVAPVYPLPTVQIDPPN